MIPKIIHYCWFGGNEKSPLIKNCILSWSKLMPDWTIMEWNEQTFNIEQSRYVNDAIINKKYAFASDYVRLYALYNYGGIYLDTDVLLFVSLDSFRSNKMFTAHECFESIFSKFNNSIDKNGIHIPSTPMGGFGIMSAIIGAEKNHWFIKECIDFYENIEFKLDSPLIIDGLMASLLEKYGYRYIDELQIIKDITIYSSETFLTNKYKYFKDVVAIHWCTGSWRKLRLGEKIVYSFPFLALRYFRIKSLIKKRRNQ